MTHSRRAFLTTALGAALLPLCTPVSGNASIAGTTPLNAILPRDYVPPKPSSDYEFKLIRATLDVVQEHYSGRNLPVWGKRLDEIDLEKRVSNIIYWLVRGVNEHKKVYPVDPAWLVAQIMAESFFYEFAVSPAFAVGVCQFVPTTALSYKMRLYNHEKGGLKIALPEEAASYVKYSKLRQELWQLRNDNREYRGNEAKQLKTLLQSIREGLEIPDVDKRLRFLTIQEELEEKLKAAREGYIGFLKANFEGRSIFNKNDLAFLSAFDERVTYRKPVFAMAEMMAGALRARNGNILAAASGYNAGLSTTQDIGVYKPFGRIPNITETSTYVSRIFINHHQIVSRMG
ncbi:MAG: transglycosylase SLT domain-containing protein [Desulfovibrionales bacterium]